MTKTVLIADAEANMRTCLGHLMESEGWRVLPAADGEAALAIAGKEVPDLALLAVDLDAVDGYELCQRLRGDSRLAGLKIIMVTSKTNVIDLEKGLAFGADAYITKPFANAELTKTARDLLA